MWAGTMRLSYEVTAVFMGQSVGKHGSVAHRACVRLLSCTLPEVLGQPEPGMFRAAGGPIYCCLPEIPGFSTECPSSRETPSGTVAKTYVDVGTISSSLPVPGVCAVLYSFNSGIDLCNHHTS